MKDRGVIRFKSEGKHHGCWVMPFESHTGTDEHESDKIIVRSNGTVTYTGKDIAYQLWKLGQLGLDFNYKPFRSYPDDQVLGDDHVRTPTCRGAASEFGGGQLLQRDRLAPVLSAGNASAVPNLPELGEEAVFTCRTKWWRCPAAAGLGIASRRRRKRPTRRDGPQRPRRKADDLINRCSQTR